MLVHTLLSAEAPPAELEILQTQMESLVSNFENTSIFRIHAGGARDPLEEYFLPVTLWPGVKFFAIKKRTQIKSIEWNDQGFGGTIDFREVPDSLFALRVETNALEGSLDAAGLPRTLLVLMARQNRLTGAIEWAALPPKLTVLGIEHNALSGTVDLSAVPRALHALKIEGNNFERIVGQGGVKLVVFGMHRAVLGYPEGESMSPHPDSLEQSGFHGDSVYRERPSARRNLLPELGGQIDDGEDDSTWTSFDNDTYETEESSMSRSHLPLSHSVSEHHATFGDYSHSYVDPRDDSGMFDDDGSFHTEYDDQGLPPLDVSSIMANDVDELSMLEESILKGTPMREKKDPVSVPRSVYSAVAYVLKSIVSGIMRAFEGIFRILVFPITQPYPSTVDFANF